MEEEQVGDIREFLQPSCPMTVPRSPGVSRWPAPPTGRDQNSGFNIRGLEGNRVPMLVDGGVCYAAIPSVPMPLAVTIWTWVCSVGISARCRACALWPRTAWAVWSTSSPCSPADLPGTARPLAAGLGKL